MFSENYLKNRMTGLLEVKSVLYTEQRIFAVDSRQLAPRPCLYGAREKQMSATKSGTLPDFFRAISSLFRVRERRNLLEAEIGSRYSMFRAGCFAI